MGRLWLRIRYRIVQGIWDVGTWLREWSCVLAGGTHDYLPGQTECAVCGHNPFRRQS